MAASYDISAPWVPEVVLMLAFLSVLLVVLAAILLRRFPDLLKDQQPLQLWQTGQERRTSRPSTGGFRALPSGEYLPAQTTGVKVQAGKARRRSSDSRSAGGIRLISRSSRPIVNWRNGRHMS